MAMVRTLLMLLGALGILMLGAVSPTLAATEAAPCHEMAGMASEPPASAPERPMKTMGCCVACIAAPAIVPPVRDDAADRPASPRPVLRVLPTGRRVLPETGPPRA